MPNERILVVDDNIGIVRSCVSILERQGFTVLGRTDSPAIPHLLKQQAFDLLLTDIKMPKMDGLALLQIAKELDPHLIVVLMTGYGSIEDAIKAIRLGAQDFLMKPFEPTDLITTIQDSLARRTLIQDRLRLQTLLPLLEINRTLQSSNGEVSLIRHVLEITQRETGAARLAWLSCSVALAEQIKGSSGLRDQNGFIEMAVITSTDAPVPGLLPLSQETLAQLAEQTQPMWVTNEEQFITQTNGQANIIGALLPLVIKNEVVGVLTAETAGHPFSRLSLYLLSVLAGQLAIIIENVMLYQEQRRLDRLAALGEMSAVVAHEIRNPIAGIAAGVEYLTRNTTAESPDFAGVVMIKGEIKRVNRILEDILFAARPLSLELSLENMAEIVKEVVSRCQSQIQASQVEVSFNSDPDLLLIKCDRQRMEQVFSNLIINGTQAMANGGQLDIQVAQNQPESVVITIADTGTGIPREMQQQIFEPFFTTKTKGTGLGLTVARRIIEQHGGSLMIHSEINKGTCFKVTLPHIP